MAKFVLFGYMLRNCHKGKDKDDRVTIKSMQLRYYVSQFGLITVIISDVNKTNISKPRLG